MSADQPKRLGRGLSALLGENAAAAPAAAAPVRGVRSIPVGDIVPGRFQPRRDFAPEALQELAASIRAQGVLQPILVRRSAGATPFELVAGERRWRAAQLAQLHEIPAIVRELSDDEALEIGLVENLQRQDLNPIEEAQAYRRLIEEFRHTQEEIAKALGKSRPHVANMVRLLELPDPVLTMVAAGDLSVGHAKLLVTHPNPVNLAHIIAAKHLTVREAERLIQGGKQKRRTGHAPIDANILDVERRLKEALGLGVMLQHQINGKGRLVIFYQSLDQIDDVLRRLGVKS